MIRSVISELKDSFPFVIKSVHPETIIADHLPKPPIGKVYVIGAGKASAAMAHAFEASYTGEYEGAIVTRYGFGMKTQRIRILEAAHPVPDIAGHQAVDELLEIINKAGENDLIVCLLSGGGSALLTSPVDGVSFEELQDLNKQLLLCGAGITQINTVRKHLNRALGGGLAKAATGKRMLTLAISDVVGDDPSVIASGATVGDASTLEDARQVITDYRINAPRSIMDALNDPQNETPLPDNPLFEMHNYKIIARGKSALDTACEYWKNKGFAPFIYDTDVEGDTNEAARKHVTAIQDILSGKSAHHIPCAMISGGETTVTVRNDYGRGGPNTQFMLQALIALNGHARVYGMACDTDGIDGNADNAGAFITPDTLDKATALGLDPQEYLENNNSYEFFKTLDQHMPTGPSMTNVNDYRVFLILP